MKVTYTRKGDYLLPDLYLEKGENYGRLGRYGILKLHFIAQNNQALYETLLMTNKLTHHLLLVSDSCENKNIVEISVSSLYQELFLISLIKLIYGVLSS